MKVIEWPNAHDRHPSLDALFAAMHGSLSEPHLVVPERHRHWQEQVYASEQQDRLSKHGNQVLGIIYIEMRSSSRISPPAR